MATIASPSLPLQASAIFKGRLACLRRSFPARLALVVVTVSLGLAAGCEGERPVVVDGSSTVFPISVAAQVAYTRAVEGVPKITVDYHGTGGGFGRYIEGEVDIVNASRPAKAIEEERAWARGYTWSRYLVGHDGITVAVNPENTFVDSLSITQLQALFERDSTITTWRDLNPEWPDQPISFYTPDPDSGTYDTFVHEALDLSEQREDIQPSADDNVLVNGIAGDLNSLGYFGFAYYMANQDRLRAVPIRRSDDAEPVPPSIETIYDGSYVPLSRPLFIYVKDEAMKRPVTAEFVTFYLDHVAELAEQAGYVSPNLQERSENLATLGRVKATITVAETTSSVAD
ncbi:PstS family phosphate ABC transporter substrate-binding protein [Tautonia marina]|uniref:PstS family phosphate ABC transporter substrate-binding protein n=1 Tax=Tautonia marina TaxID=2653855 RepID=UPI001260D454|nr:PstS family phosphate ABC transporter substrate-binding protein [Tautonia marina]